MASKEERESRNRLELEDRKLLSLQGIIEVNTFCDKHLLIKTNMGSLSIKGSQLHICLLNLEEGRLEVEGQVDSLEYIDKEAGHKNFLKRLFK